MGDNNIEYKFPLFTLKKITPLLVIGDKIHVIQIEGESMGRHFNMYDNKCITLNEYLEKEMDCVLEITRGKIWYPYQKKEMPKKVLQAQYLWHTAPHVFFPELISLLEYPDESNSDDENEEAFENAAQEIYSNWGVNGLGMEVFQSKPIIQTDIGAFFINEFEFEEDIDVWELHEEIYIEIHEIYLRGVSLNVPKIEKKTEMTSEQKEEYARGIALKKERLQAYHELKERVKKRIEAGEGTKFL